MKNRLSFWEKLKAYRLKNNVVIVIVLFWIVVLSIVLYLVPGIRHDAVLGNILMAVFTSFLATIMSLIAEVYVKFKDNERDQFLEDIHTFGIDNLNKNKEDVLKELLKDSDNMIWISGYRLIMTNRIKADIAEAIRRGAEVRAILCPPWSEAFHMVYGTNAKVADNYYQVLYSIYKAKEGMENRDYKIYFINKPLFSDTYRVDQNLVTGPYMHNKDGEYKRLMAKDFFSYNLVKKSRLYELVESEFLTLCNEAGYELDWEKFAKAYEEQESKDLNDEQKCRLLQDACIPRTDCNKNM